jgi:hypothetical protein
MAREIGCCTCTDSGGGGGGGGLFDFCSFRREEFKKESRKAVLIAKVMGGGAGLLCKLTCGIVFSSVARRVCVCF